MGRASLLRSRILPGALSVVLIEACVAQVPAVITPASSVLLFAPHSQQVKSLSGGDAVRGRKAFLDLQCHACHRVAEDETLPVRKDAWEGPLLRDLAAESAEAVAWKIVTRTELGPETLYESEMTDAASAMTERQLADLVAYLRHPAAGAAGGKKNDKK